jgi:hypothetical protein
VTNAVCTSCGLAGWGVVRIPWAEIPQRRKNPGLAPGLTPAAHLKLADEQTVVACAAVLNACDRAGLGPTGFADWGVVAASRYIGRARLAPAFRRFQKIGVRGVSPLIIPTMSNHSMAGTICLILRSHGPNFGVGGGTTSMDELLLNALSLVEEESCRGVWAVMTAWDPEPIPDSDGECLTPAVGVGVALALVPHASSGAVRLRMPGSSGSQANGNGTVFELADALERPGREASWLCPISGGGVLELTAGAVTTSMAPLAA